MHSALDTGGMRRIPIPQDPLQDLDSALCSYLQALKRVRVDSQALLFELMAKTRVSKSAIYGGLRNTGGLRCAAHGRVGEQRRDELQVLRRCSFGHTASLNARR